MILLGYLIGQLGGLLPIPGGIGGIDGGLIGALVVLGAPLAATAAAVLAYRAILFWLPLLIGGPALVVLAREPSSTLNPAPPSSSVSVLAISGFCRTWTAIGSMPWKAGPSR